MGKRHNKKIGAITVICLAVIVFMVFFVTPFIYSIIPLPGGYKNIISEMSAKELDVVEFQKIDYAIDAITQSIIILILAYVILNAVKKSYRVILFHRFVAFCFFLLAFHNAIFERIPAQIARIFTRYGGASYAVEYVIGFPYYLHLYTGVIIVYVVYLFWASQSLNKFPSGLPPKVGTFLLLRTTKGNQYMDLLMCLFLPTMARGKIVIDGHVFGYAKHRGGVFIEYEWASVNWIKYKRVPIPPLPIDYGYGMIGKEWKLFWPLVKNPLRSGNCLTDIIIPLLYRKFFVGRK